MPASKAVKESQAKARKTSIAAEVIELLLENVPTDAEIRRRQKAFDELAKLRAKPPLTPGPFPPAEELIREDRER